MCFCAAVPSGLRNVLTDDANQQLLRWLHICPHPRHVKLRTMSKCELIELKDLSLNDPIELAAPSPPPVRSGQTGLQQHHVVRLVGDSVNIEAAVRRPEEGALGHSFQPYSYTHLTWCDLCGEFIWGLYQKSLRCSSEYSQESVDQYNLTSAGRTL